jgi:hypothetical protein
MKVMVFVKATAASEAGIMPGEELIAAMTKFNEELAGAGVIVDGEGLKPSSHGKRVRFSGDSRTVVDGPFAETSELVAGYWLWNVDSMEEAVRWAEKCPNPMPDGGELELRPLYGPEDFGEEFTPELREREERIREEVKRQQSSG